MWVSTCEWALAAAWAATSGTVGELGPRGESAVVFTRYSALSHLQGHRAGPPQALSHVGRLSTLRDAADSCRNTTQPNVTANST